MEGIVLVRGHLLSKKYIVLFCLSATVLLLCWNYTLYMDADIKVMTGKGNKQGGGHKKEPVDNGINTVTSNSNDGMTRGKRFVYLVNAKTRTEVTGLKADKDRDVFWLTFKVGDKTGNVNAPNSTWSSGRNMILDYAIEQAKKRGDGGYLYYIFLDNDVILRTRSEPHVNWKPWSEMKADPYERFEDFLLEFEPAVGYGRYAEPYRQHHELDKPTNIGWDFDACFNAFHRDTLSFLLPYETSMDNSSWYNAPWIMKQLISMLYNTHRLQCNSVFVENKFLHSKKSPSEKGPNVYNDKQNFHIPRNYLLHALQPMAQTNPPIKNHLKDAILKGNAISQLQIRNAPGVGQKKGNTSYIVTDKFISNFWDKSHAFVKGRLKARVKVVDLLKLKENEKTEFVPDPVYSLPNFKLSLEPPK
ncbi:uncharacterized protein LOC106151544 isoform X1 [Lingula anatina]|uniref:Uncharacterized protein LOC106151544 isoform X1 n=1 Tax=Lingula anatina TaxID=7574 RepID=A0A1S3H317_LINAN|nr:uncharacterized protein LOC106151544 isoform X1 [Lingula anatina]XP_013380335.1 uncharacterized protein LOC106151544 isoform X1 [Lingula anatina]XP_013380342.1 uncharacterized protein LOC106151544 isoform X1 [Lingula anatina]XP_013380349.1 uncharacterized protein LOC106151544 isoform X1 [Lingula anatina]|eukprot:XP_013380326.1 uncharacterized protein LOC106151544 isoform X1 [Lingula anatina]